MITGYCTNVHPARNLAELLDNLRDRVGAVRRLVTRDELMSCGLWLNATTAAELRVGENLERLRHELAANGLAVNSLNGFPQGDFHQPVVKHSVYQPDWSDPSRLQHTCALAEILAELLDDRTRGSISTLPLGWRGVRQPANRDPRYKSPEDLRKSELHDLTLRMASIDQLAAWVDFARRLEDQSGKRIRLAIEPEPGCTLDRSHDVVGFFQQQFGRSADRRGLPWRDYVGICHDVCHAAVMREKQGEVAAAYRAADVPVVKVQVSSALVATFGEDKSQRENVERALDDFSEPRYLHQTTDHDGNLYEDLPAALQQADRKGEWRVHFHVPIHMAVLAPGLSTTQAEIGEAVHHFGGAPEIDWEIETYAWNVLPVPFQPESLTQGIAGEIGWFRSLTGRRREPTGQ